MSLLFRSSLRHTARHPLLTVLSLVGIALGVAVVVAIDLTNESARRAFALSNEGALGKATHHVIGGPSGLDESLYVRLRLEKGLREAAPVVEGFVTSPREPGRAFRLLGVDPFAEAPFRAHGASGGPSDSGALLTEPGAALISRKSAERFAIGMGDRLPVLRDGAPRELRIAGFIEAPAEAAPSSLDDLFIADIATAQEVLGWRGRLSRIDLALDDGHRGASMRAAVDDVCAGRCAIVSSAASSAATSQMTRAFGLNLGAMSLLALVVGTFLIYNTMTFSVVQRRPLLGVLRALGVTRKEIFRMVVEEALLVAVPATALGLVLGALLATELLKLVTRSINDLYFVVNVRALHVDPFTVVKGIVLGLVATVAAALAPAHEATRVPPTITLRRSETETRLEQRAGRLALGGAVVIATAVGLLLGSGRNLVLSYVGLFGVLLGSALATPFFTRTFARAARPVAGALFGVVGRMAARGIASTLSRTSVASAALMIAVATTVGVGIMVGSFRRTVSEWLASSLESDIYVAPPSLVARKGDGTLLPDVVGRIVATPGIAYVNTVRNRRVRTDAGEVDLHVPSFGGPRRSRRFLAEEGDVLARLDAEDVVAITEPYAFHKGLGVGSVMRVATDRGTEPFRVVGVYADYASDEGRALMSDRTYRRHFDDRDVSGLAVVARPETDLEKLREAIRERAGVQQALTIHANREFREASLAIFDRTFAVTRVLRLLSIGVAFVGILSALMSLALERSRELAVLRATGLLPRQLAVLVAVQTSLMGLLAGLLAIPLGVALALILVFVINRRSFGWTLHIDLSAPALFEAVGLAIVAALLAGIYPAFKMSRANPARALREE